MQVVEKARLPLSFEELLGYAVKAGIIDRAVAGDIHSKQSRQLGRLRAERRQGSVDDQSGKRDGRGPGSAISPIELLASFGAKSGNGKEVSEDVLTELYARNIGLPYVKVDPLELNAQFVTSIVSKAFARKHNILPIDVNNESVLVATSNPCNSAAFDSIERVAQRPIELVITPKTDIQNIISQLFGFRRSVDSAERDLGARVIDLGNFEQLTRMKSDREIEASDQHVVNAVEYLFKHAFQQRASDIHIEPKRNVADVRLRIDGALHVVHSMPIVVHRAVVNRIKTIARLDIGEKRRPQDGRIKTEFKGKAVEFRVSTLPVAFGEKVVLRIFDPEIAESSLSDLGFFERELQLFDRLIHQPHGIVLVTGPTGSGKTTTLYTALRTLATDDVNITTIEDPIEMVFERLNQTAILPAIGITFAESLRTILRQDPDIIMVGEVRDQETAQNAIQAALTGHLVFSTVHTNDAPSAITRLSNLGIQSYLLASTLSGVVAQRLMRKICPHCMDERPLLDTEAEILGSLMPEDLTTVQFGAGCVDCRQTGYRGRSAIYEMFEMNRGLIALTMAGADASVIKEQAVKDGMVTLRHAAVKKMALGVTSFEEVLRVTGH